MWLRVAVCGGVWRCVGGVWAAWCGVVRCVGGVRGGALVRGLLRGRVAVALLGLDVEQHRLVAAAVAHVLEDGHQVVQVVAVDGAAVKECSM